MTFLIDHFDILCTLEILNKPIYCSFTSIVFLYKFTHSRFIWGRRFELLLSIHFNTFIIYLIGMIQSLTLCPIINKLCLDLILIKLNFLQDIEFLILV